MLYDLNLSPRCWVTAVSTTPICLVVLKWGPHVLQVHSTREVLPSQAAEELKWVQCILYLIFRLKWVFHEVIPSQLQECLYLLQARYCVQYFPCIFLHVRHKLWSFSTYRGEQGFKLVAPGFRDFGLFFLNWHMIIVHIYEVQGDIWHVHAMRNDQRIVSISFTSNMYHFLVLKTFKIFFLKFILKYTINHFLLFRRFILFSWNEEL